MGQKLERLAGAFAIAQLPPDAALPDWAAGPGFVSVTRTAAELSILCHEASVPAGLRAEGGWTGYGLKGPFEFGETGVAVSVLAPLAVAEVPILLISTFDTDYLFVKSASTEAAETALTNAGHTIA